LKLCASPKFIYWNLNSKVIILRGWDFGKRLEYEDCNVMKGINVLANEDSKSYLALFTFPSLLQCKPIAFILPSCRGCNKKSVYIKSVDTKSAGASS
jgi:hypothetical protein